MKRRSFQTIQTFVYCKECGAEHHFYSVSQYRNTLGSIKMSKDAKYTPPSRGYSKETIALRTCLEHTKGREVINHFDRNVILLKKTGEKKRLTSAVACRYRKAKKNKYCKKCSTWNCFEHYLKIPNPNQIVLQRKDCQVCGEIVYIDLYWKLKPVHDGKCLEEARKNG